MYLRTRRAVGLTAASFFGALAGCASHGHSGDGAFTHPAAYNRPYTIRGRTYTPSPAADYDEVGLASWYGHESGGRTSNGERLTLSALTAAHRTLPIPSVLEVTNLGNGRRIQVRLNDRGPFQENRLLDLSREAARRLGFLDRGSARVRVRYIGPAASMLAANDRDPQTDGAAIPVGPDLRAPEGLQGWAVRVGAFNDARRASQAVAALRGAGQARLSVVEEVGRTQYRVIILPDDGMSAEETRRRVVALGYAEAQIFSAD